MRNRSILQSGTQETLAESLKPRRLTVFVGGFPCQDLSIAGRQKGLEADRSGLWLDYFEVITTESPEWIVTENVGHTWRRWVPSLRRALYSMGYASLPIRVRAFEVGAPHERSRIFLISHSDSEQLRELSRWWFGPGRKMADELAESWHPTSRDLGMDDGLSSWVDRRRAIGNAIVPQIAQIIARGIREVSK